MNADVFFDFAEHKFFFHSYKKRDKQDERDKRDERAKQDERDEN
jgi:hypothetical protein